MKKQSQMHTRKQKQNTQNKLNQQQKQNLKTQT